MKYDRLRLLPRPDFACSWEARFPSGRVSHSRAGFSTPGGISTPEAFSTPGAGFSTPGAGFSTPVRDFPLPDEIFHCFPLPERDFLLLGQDFLLPGRFPLPGRDFLSSPGAVIFHSRSEIFYSRCGIFRLRVSTPIFHSRGGIIYS